MPIYVRTYRLWDAVPPGPVGGPRPRQARDTPPPPVVPSECPTLTVLGSGPEIRIEMVDDRHTRTHPVKGSDPESKE